MTDFSQPQDFFAKITEASKIVIGDMKNLIALINEDNIGENLLQTATEAEMSLNSLAKFALEEEFASAHNLNNTEPYLIFCSAVNQLKGIRIADAAKEVFSNPYDFMTKQNLRNCSKTVVDTIKKLVAATNNLSNVIEKVHTPEESPKNDTTGNLIQHAKTALLSLNKLKQITFDPKSTEKDLITSAKEISSAISAILLVVKDTHDNEATERLKESVISVLSCSKILIRNRHDEVFINQFSSVLARVVESIRNIVEVTTKPWKNNNSLESSSEEGSTRSSKAVTPNASLSEFTVSSPAPVASPPPPVTPPPVAVVPREPKPEISSVDSALSQLPPPPAQLDTISSPEVATPKTKAFEMVNSVAKAEFVSPVSPAPVPPQRASSSASLFQNLLRKPSVSVERPPTKQEMDFALLLRKFLGDAAEAQWNQLPVDSKNQLFHEFNSGVIPPVDTTFSSLQKQYSSEYFQRHFLEETKLDDSATEESKLSQECLVCVKDLGEAFISFISQCYDDMSTEHFDDTRNIGLAGKELKALCKRVLTTTDNMAKVCRINTADNVRSRALQIFDNSPAQPKIIEDFSQTEGLSVNFFVRKVDFIAEAMQSLALYTCGNLVNLSHQLLHSRSHFAFSLFITCSALGTLIQQTDNMLNLVETIRFVKKSVAQSSNTEEALGLDFSKEDDLPIWDDYFERTSQKSSKGKDKNPYPRSLNLLIETLTSEENLDNKFVKTFITTYQSFMTPAKLLDKLTQRFNVPDKIPKEKTIQIQLRVGIVLKYWVENQGDDFTAGLISKLEQFIENNLKQVHPELAKLLQKEMRSKVVERNFHLKEFRKRLPIDFRVPSFGLNRTFFLYFMALNEQEIARQLTNSDFALFQAIQPKELLNQSWNKPSSKVKSPNVLNLISRANRVSFWVATLILSVETVSERVKVMTKLVSVADELRKINNFHTLMGFVAGLNQGSIMRLKKTFEELPSNVTDMSKTLEKLMSPEGSYKNYRAAMSKATVPILPYIGVPLVDLTFIEENNDTTKENKVNFVKRELVYTSISDLLQYQITPYSFPVVEPLFSFLRDFPVFEEKDLYDLSLRYEPRDPSINTSVKEKKGFATLSKGLSLAQLTKKN